MKKVPEFYEELHPPFGWNYGLRSGCPSSVKFTSRDRKQREMDHCTYNRTAVQRFRYPASRVAKGRSIAAYTKLIIRHEN
jgi:hypothetical protein